MNKHFFQIMIVRLITWGLIYFGFFQGEEFAYNIGLFFFWAIIVSGLIYGAGLLLTDDIDILRKNKSLRDGPDKYRTFSKVAIVAEILVLAGLGFFWTAAFYGISCLLARIGKDVARERLDAEEART